MPDILPLPNEIKTSSISDEIKAARLNRWSRRKAALAKASKRGGLDASALGLMHQIQEQTGEVVGPPQADLERRLEAAARLGGAHLIPDIEVAFDAETGESIGEYECGEQEIVFFDLIRNRLAVGQRAFSFRGPPGTGKDSFARQIAAIRSAPYQAFNIGPTFSFEDAIGSDGLMAERVYDDEGKLVGVVSASAQLQGPLARWVQEDAVVVIQEPEGLENEAVRLHSAAGDNVGDPTKRFLTINSSAGEVSVPVHPECLIVFTYNSGEEDVRFKTALHDRMGNFDFEYPDLESESRRWSRMVTKMMAFQQEAPELQRDYTAEEILPMVRVFERARAAHRQNPADFVDVPGSRQGAYCYCDLLLQGYGGDEAAVDTMTTMLRYLLPGSEIMTVEQRDAKIRDVLTADDFQDLNDIAIRAAEARRATD
jgi:hypothetical protein